MKIFVEGLQFSGHHGVYEEERQQGRLFEVDLTVEVDTARAAGTDAVDDTLDYRGLADLILDIGVRGDSARLVERLARQMVDEAFERWPQVQAVELTLRKRALGVPGEPRWVGVSINERRERE